MKLINILKRNFILPLSICLIFTSLIVLLLNIFYSQKYNKGDFQINIKRGKESKCFFSTNFNDRIII